RNKVTCLHNRLEKYESSMLIIQLHTGRLGPRNLLFDSHVPDVTTPRCRCGNADETPNYIFFYC
ncbi:hypothetical protein BGZ61DRAFT_321488, partial [Ilyonectria robusta]|uniref:uncharacterized protein n=1 Tax=Ilyonectria robusta TaxID=1079257 RepID=UPI001E8DF96C